MDTEKRDPRIDPKPGDILWAPRKIARKVISVNGSVVRYSHPLRGGPSGYQLEWGHDNPMYLSAWRRWAKNAIVERKA